MNRIVKFRGKRIPDHLKKKNDGTWVYGYLYESADGVLCIDEWKVDPETVGQFVGRQDINGKDVYEGDFLTTPPDDILGIRYAPIEVKFESCLGDFGKFTGWFVPEDCEIIGNRFDNPELVKEPIHADN